MIMSRIYDIHVQYNGVKHYLDSIFDPDEATVESLKKRLVEREGYDENIMVEAAES
jgi:hypothetical protein